MAGFNSKQQRDHLNGYELDHSALPASSKEAPKLKKKRKRPSKKVPTTVLDASSENFREMVEKLTGLATMQRPSTSAEYTASRQMQPPLPSMRAEDVGRMESLNGRIYDFDHKDGWPLQGVVDDLTLLQSTRSSGPFDGSYFQRLLWNRLALQGGLEEEPQYSTSMSEDTVLPSLCEAQLRSYNSPNSSSAQYQNLGSSEYSDGATSVAGLHLSFGCSEGMNGDQRLAVNTSRAYSMAFETEVAQIPALKTTNARY